MQTLSKIEAQTRIAIGRNSVPHRPGTQVEKDHHDGVVLMTRLRVVRTQEGGGRCRDTNAKDVITVPAPQKKAIWAGGGRAII